jgi:hypothetical protein
MDRLSVAQAAAVLNVTQAAVYKRIQRGTIEHDKDSEGRVFVYLDASDIPSDKSMDEPDPSTDMSSDKSMDGSNSAELIAELRTHNEHLRQEVEAWREEARRKDTILMTMAQRIPELEPAKDSSSEAPESPVMSSGETDKGKEPSEQQEPSQRRSWWRQFFGLQ